MIKRLWFRRLPEIESFASCYLTCSEYKALSTYLRRGELLGVVKMLDKLNTQVERLLIGGVNLPEAQVFALREIRADGKEYERNKAI